MKGVYLLLISVKKDLIQKIGSLGFINFKKGDYVYVGSAQNNLIKRVERHLSKKKKIHWHIDYLLKNDSVKITKIFYKQSGKEQECFIAKALGDDFINGFGCSDCKCNSHLIKVINEDFIKNQGVKEL